MKAKKRKLTRAQLVKKGMGVGAVAMRAILAGKGTEQVIAAVKRSFPKAKTTPGCVAWYRAELRRRGEKVPEARKAGAA